MFWQNLHTNKLVRFYDGVDDIETGNATYEVDMKALSAPLKKGDTIGSLTIKENGLFNFNTLFRYYFDYYPPLAYLAHYQLKVHLY